MPTCLELFAIDLENLLAGSAADMRINGVSWQPDDIAEAFRFGCDDHRCLVNGLLALADILGWVHDGMDLRQFLRSVLDAFPTDPAAQHCLKRAAVNLRHSELRRLLRLDCRTLGRMA